MGKVIGKIITEIFYLVPCSFLKSCFCTHDYEHQANLYGDAAMLWNARSLWRCKHCRKADFRDSLEPESPPPETLGELLEYCYALYIRKPKES